MATLRIACIAAKLRDECPLWVNNGHRGYLKECPLYPQKRTSVERVGRSPLCHNRTKCGAANCATFSATNRKSRDIVSPSGRVPRRGAVWYRGTSRGAQQEKAND